MLPTLQILMQVPNTCALFVVETVINYYAYQNCVCRADMTTSHSAFNLAALQRDSSPNTTAFPWYDFQGAARSRCEVRHAYILTIDTSYISEFKPATQWDESQPFLSCFGGRRMMYYRVQGSITVATLCLLAEHIVYLLNTSTSPCTCAFNSPV